MSKIRKSMAMRNVITYILETSQLKANTELTTIMSSTDFLKSM